MHILALVKDPKSERKVVLLKQYRPPAGAVVVGESGLTLGEFGAN